MKKILIFVIAIAMSVAHAGAAVRDGNATQRANTQKRISTTSVSERTTTGRTTVLNSSRSATNRTATTTSRTPVRVKTNVIGRATTTPESANVSPRTAGAMSETRTGAIYETCKTAFFTCMDQFCALKNDDYRRCSCSNRVSDMEKQRATLNDAGQQLTVFTENIDVVGLTAAQATAMRTASEGENALSNDTSASKALLQAIMNSISGNDTTVGGKYSDLNTINMSYDLTTVFGADANQIVASYNGQELYTAVYSRCRHAVADDCNNASLQRAVNAYLMAIEQDCNTVQTAINDKKSQMKSAIREGSAMLDLARVENRRKHNSDDITTCINNVESAILSEQVCGSNYHKCLDNGEFIDLATGAPITGVINFYELGNLLTFEDGVDPADQRLSKRSNNRAFVSNFEKRTKKFAKPALDKCTEIADDVWSEYLDKAMLAIYYAQKAKVAEIKQGCFDFVSSCYADSDGSITAAMSELIGSGLTLLQPDKIALTTKMCTDYVNSCNNMFSGKIIEEYVNSRQDTDTLAACRAVVKQCFDKYGGSGYENFYYPYSGLFTTETATKTLQSATPGDWFTLYDCTKKDCSTKEARAEIDTYVSPCARQLNDIAACKDHEVIEKAFGGFDLMYTNKNSDESQNDQLSFDIVSADAQGAEKRYGRQINDQRMKNRSLRPVGVATEVYNQIIDALSVQCTNVRGRFVERQFIKENLYGGRNRDNICLWFPQEPENTQTSSENANDSAYDTYNKYKRLAIAYGIFLSDSPSETTDGTEGSETSTSDVPDYFNGENMCPRDYNLNVETSFWGACLCWENGARRSKNGRNAICVAELPAQASEETTDGTENTGNEETDTTETTNSTTQQTNKPMDKNCYSVSTDERETKWNYDLASATDVDFYSWCTQKLNSMGQVCPFGFIPDVKDPEEGYVCTDPNNQDTTFELIKMVPNSIYK